MAPSAPTRSVTAPQAGRGRGLQWLERFGPRACLLSWLPAVGDPLCAVAGWLRMPFWPCVAYMAVGKFARYVTMTACCCGCGRGCSAPDGHDNAPRIRERHRMSSGTTPTATTPTPAYDDLAATQLRMHHLGTCSPSPPGTRPPTCRHGQARRAPRPWPRCRRCCTACAPTRRWAPRIQQAERRAAERLSSAPTCARSAAAGSWPPPARIVGAAAVAGHRALRTRLAPAAPGQRLGRLPGQLPRGADAGARTGGAAGRPFWLQPLRSDDGRLRAGLSTAQVDRVFGAVRQWLPGLIGQVLARQRSHPLIEPVGPFALPRSVRCASS
jgi:hypothetical protein